VMKGLNCLRYWCRILARGWLLRQIVSSKKNRTKSVWKIQRCTNRLCLLRNRIPTAGTNSLCATSLLYSIRYPAQNWNEPHVGYNLRFKLQKAKTSKETKRYF
jgi:hypothetical protein